MTAVQFWSTQGDFGCFSNFSRHQVVIKNKRYRTTEHYYQSQKFATTDPLYANKIAKTARPSEAAKLGRDRSRKLLRKDWESAKIGVMRIALRAKVDQHPEIRELLLSTGDRKMEETSPTDAFWGTGQDGKGQNWLGRLWMELRASLRGEAVKIARTAPPPTETTEEFMERLIEDFPKQGR